MKYRMGLVRVFIISALSFSTVAVSQQRDLSKEESQKVLDRYYALIHNAKTIHIVEGPSHGGQIDRVEYFLKRPNQFRAVYLGSEPGKGKVESRSYMTAKLTYSVDVARKSYTIMDRIPDTPSLNGFEPFVTSKRPGYTLGGKVRGAAFNNKPAYAIETGEQSLPGSMVSVFVDRESLIPLGWEYAWRGTSEITTFKEVKLNEPMDDKDFAWTPPKDFKLESDMRRKK